MRGAGSGDQRQGQAEENLSLVCDAMGDPAATAGPGAAFKAGADGGNDEPKSRRRERHSECNQDAKRKTKAVCELRAKTERMKNNGTQGCGNDGLWEKRKPRAGFPLFPQPFEIAKSAIPTFPQPRRLPRGKVEIQKQDSTFPSRFPSLTKLKKGGFP